MKKEIGNEAAPQRDTVSLICISCPMGCRLTVDRTDENNLIVTGNTCPRGAAYAKDEVTSPKRTVTGSVRVTGGNIHMASVKTSAPIPKNLVFDSLEALKTVTLAAPVEIGDTVLKNVCGSGADFVATKKIGKAAVDNQR